MTEIIIMTIATFGISALISNYDAPFGLFRNLREVKWLPFHCTVCTACWMAMPITALSGIGIIGYLAVIGGVIIIERLT